MYLMGKRLPGDELLSKLISLGCDLDWLLLLSEDQALDLSADKVTVKTYHYETPVIKDKVIISQAEEIQELKEEVEKLKAELTLVREDVKNFKKNG